MSDMATASLVLSSSVLLIAALLSWKEWERPPGAKHRALSRGRPTLRSSGRSSGHGIVVMVILAVGLYVGSRIPHKLENRSNPQFLGIWLGIFLLILFLLGLAMIDWLALRIFARRHRNQILRERVELFKKDKPAKKDQGTNGHGNGPLGDLFR